MRIASKLEVGNFKGAVRLACADDTLADYSSVTLEALNWKHPPSHPNSTIGHLDGFSFAINEQNVRKAMLSFPNSSAGGPDGLCPQPKDFTGTTTSEGGLVLLKPPCWFVRLILSGRTPIPIHPYVFGALSVALCKVDGEIQPITVGCTLRRLAAKWASLFCSARNSRTSGLSPAWFWCFLGCWSSCACYMHFPSEFAAEPSCG